MGRRHKQYSAFGSRPGSNSENHGNADGNTDGINDNEDDEDEDEDKGNAADGLKHSTYTRAVIAHTG